MFIGGVQSLSHVTLWHVSHTKSCDSLRPHGLQHARLPCPSLSPWVCSNSCPLSWWCHPTISSYVTPFSTCPQYFPASGSFPKNCLFASGGQSIRPYISIRPSSEYSFRIDWFHRLVVQEALKSLLQHHSLKTSILRCSAFYIVQLSHLYRTTGKTVTLTRWTFVGNNVCFFIRCLGWS